MDSEASSKKRGRPLAFSDEALDRALGTGVAAARHVTTKRGAQDVAYRIRAVLVIERFREIYPAEAQPLNWLFRPGDMRGQTWRHSLLTELGRAQKAQHIVPIALRLASVRPKTKDGIRLVRHLRKAVVEAEAAREAAQASRETADNT